MFLDFATRICYPGSMAARKKVKGLYQKRESDWWYWQPPTPKDGSARPKPVALGTKDYVEAVVKVSELAGAQQVSQAAKRGRLDEALAKYYKAKGDDSEDTRRVREMVLGNFSGVLGNPRMEAINAAMLGEWREHLMTKGGTKDGTKPIAASTAKSYLITVRAFLNWARTEGMISGDPMVQLKRHTKIKATKVHDFLTSLDRDKLLQPQGTPKHLRLVLLLGFYAGLRDKEMLAMTPEWVWIHPDGERGTIRVQDTTITYEDGTIGTWRPKGRDRREIPMHKEILAHFKKHGVESPWVVRPDKERWPKGKQSKRYDARKALETLRAAVGVRKLNFHIMRHSFATQLAMADVPIATIAYLLGDRVQVAEDHYAGFIPSRVNPLAVL